MKDELACPLKPRPPEARGFMLCKCRLITVFSIHHLDTNNEDLDLTDRRVWSTAEVVVSVGHQAAHQTKALVVF